MKYYVLSCILLVIAFSSVAKEPTFLTLPLPKQAIAANGWNYRNADKKVTKTLLHAATDYYVEEGTPVIAAADGYAMYDCQPSCNNPGTSYGYGRLIIIKHDEKNSEKEHFFTLYAHLSSSMNLPEKDRDTAKDTNNVKQNGWFQVKRGQKIGEVGRSGKQSWSHLHFAVFTGDYDSMCHPENNINCRNNTYDPYDLYRKTTTTEESASYYPPIIYLNPKENRFKTQISGYERKSGSNYTSLGINRLWVTEPPFPPVFVHPLGGKSSGTLRIQGLNFGDNKGTVRVSYSYESDSLAASQAQEEILTPTAIQWTDTEIQMEIFELNGADWGWDSFKTPILVELFKQSGEKISEFWYPFVDVPIGTYYALPATQLWKRGILNGTSKGGYRFLLPHQGETRAEFLKKLVEASGYNKSVVTVTLDNNTQQPIACVHPDFSTCQLPPFTDVWPDHEWAYAHMIIAHNLGWFNNDDGNVNSTFNPQNVITRAEAAKWLILAKNLNDFGYGYHLAISFSKVPPVFSDVPFGTSAWYFDYVYIARSLGIFGGFKDGSFGPNQGLTKAQAAKVIYNFMANN